MFAKKVFTLFIVICFVGSTLYQPPVYGAKSQDVRSPVRINYIPLTGDSILKKFMISSPLIFSAVVIMALVLLNPACSRLLVAPKGFKLAECKNFEHFADEKRIPRSQFVSFFEQAKAGKLDNDSVVYRFQESFFMTCVGIYTLQEKKSIPKKDMCKTKPKNQKWQNTFCMKKGFDKTQQRRRGKRN